MSNRTSRTNRTPDIGVLDNEHLLWTAHRKMIMSSNHQHTRKIEHHMNYAPEDSSLRELIGDEHNFTS